MSDFVEPTCPRCGGHVDVSQEPLRCDHCDAEVERKGPAPGAAGWDVRVDEVPRLSLFTVIDAIRAATGLGYKDAKGLVDGAPVVVACGRKRAAAEELAASLQRSGAAVSLHPCPGHHPS